MGDQPFVEILSICEWRDAYTCHSTLIRRGNGLMADKYRYISNYSGLRMSSRTSVLTMHQVSHDVSTRLDEVDRSTALRIDWVEICVSEHVVIISTISTHLRIWNEKNSITTGHTEAKLAWQLYVQVQKLERKLWSLIPVVQVIFGWYSSQCVCTD